MNTNNSPEEKNFEIRTYGFTELAILYNPTLQPASAANALRRWMDQLQPQTLRSPGRNRLDKRTTQVHPVANRTDETFSGGTLRIEIKNLKLDSTYGLIIYLCVTTTRKSR